MSCKFKRVACSFSHVTCDLQEITDGIFLMVDEDGSGTIKTTELRKALEAVGGALTDDDLAEATTSLLGPWLVACTFLDVAGNL